MRIIRGSANKLLAHQVPATLCHDIGDETHAEYLCGDFRVVLSKDELRSGLKGIEGREESREGLEYNHRQERWEEPS